MKFEGIDKSGGLATCPRCSATVGRFDLRYPFPVGPQGAPVGCVACLSTSNPGVYRPDFESVLAEVQDAPVGMAILTICLVIAALTIIVLALA